MPPTNLDISQDTAIDALALLIRGAVNARLLPELGGKAIERIYGAPMPLSLIGQGNVPVLLIYRVQDRDRDKGDWIFEDLSTFRFDYMLPATPKERIPLRWPVLRRVWAAVLAVCREGKDPLVQDNAEVLEAGGLARYVLGTGKADYSFVAGANNTYPMFRGEMQFHGCYPPPEAFIDFANCDTLDPWITQHTEWDLPPDGNNIVDEAVNDLILPQPP